MLGAIALTLLPTLLAYIWISKTSLKINSSYFKIALCWFTGQYVFTILVFLLATLLSFLTSDVLFKSSLLILWLVFCALIFLRKHISLLIKPWVADGEFKNILKPANIFLILFCFLFAFWFYRPQLDYRDGMIYTSPIYWDFHWHAGLIQNFAFGDNFPPQNEAFSGVAHTYHYFWAILTGIYIILGLSLVDAINFFSIATFFFMLIALIGMGEEFFGKKMIGFLAVLLALTSSSFNFADYFYKNQHMGIFDAIKNIFLNTQHPWDASFREGHHLFYYNGTFFNLFYFVEERQMIIGVLYLLLSSFIIHKRRSLSYSSLFSIGVLLGGFFLWHVHLTIVIFLALLFLLTFDSDRKRTLILLSGLSIIFIVHLIYIKWVTASPWFIDTKGFPKINLGFSDQENKPFSLAHAFNWYLYSYGLKLILLPISLIFLWAKDRKLFLLFCSIIIPTFILLNTIQLSPGSVYENHKWMRPMNFFIDLAVAFGVYTFFFTKKKILLFVPGVVIIFFLTISGIIELMPFINSKPSEVYADYPSQMSKAINLHSEPKETFVGDDAEAIQLAGRKVFVGDVLGGGLGLDKSKRQRIIENVYASTDKVTFCSLIDEFGIDFIEYNSAGKILPEYLRNASSFAAQNRKGEQVSFIEAKSACVD